MSVNIVYFDLETQRSANDVGGWANKSAMRMSLGVTYSTREDIYRIYPESDATALVAELMNADLVVGFNVIGFDYEVLGAYTAVDIAYATNTLDLSEEVFRVTGTHERLDNLGRTTLNVGKTANGMDAIKWFRQGRLRDIAEYCCYDVKLTRLIHEWGRKWGKLAYTDRTGARREFTIRWSKEPLLKE